MTEEEENPFTPDADDIESAAPAELTIDNDDCEEIEVDWYMYFRGKWIVCFCSTLKENVKLWNKPSPRISPPFE